MQAAATVVVRKIYQPTRAPLSRVLTPDSSSSYLTADTTSVLRLIIRRGDALRTDSDRVHQRVLHNHLAPDSRLQVSAVVSLQVTVRISE